MYSSPHFLVVGPAKTGTTWLYQQLRVTPGFGMPPVKEVCFFNEAQFRQAVTTQAASSRYPDDYGFETEQAGIEATFARFKRNHRLNLQAALQARAYRWAFWYSLMPFTMPAGLRFYARLFNARNGMLTGDISPPYFTLHEATIATIACSFPQLKVFMILREPAERAWSNIKMNYNRSSVKNKMTLDEYALTNACLHRIQRTSDYMGAVNRWQKYFGPRLHCLFYDDLVADPLRFVQQFADAVRPGLVIKEVQQQKIGEGTAELPSDQVLQRLVEDNMPQYLFLAEKFGVGSPAERWLRGRMG